MIQNFSELTIKDSDMKANKLSIKLTEYTLKKCLKGKEFVEKWFNTHSL